MICGRMDDGGFIDFAAAELEKIGLIDREDVIDGTLVRVPRPIPRILAHTASSTECALIWTSSQIFIPIGRNGMHRYNNQDHSMLAANSAVNSIINGGSGKAGHLAHQCRR